ncbi:MAG: PTS sugar transporter subunit IIA [Qingshengfaniella sp.]
MDLGAVLKPEAIKVLGSLTSKKRLLQELSEIAASAYGMDAGKALDALQDRESIGPTGVGDGVALPHAKFDLEGGVVGVFVRLDKPLDFDSVDRQPVDLIFALFAPEQCGVSHLKALAVVARAMRNPSTRAKLRANDDPATLHAILSDAEQNQAA